MRKIGALSLVLSVLSAGCIFGGGPRGQADELSNLARRVDGATYAAVWRFNFERQAAPGVSTRLEIIQEPPTAIRKIVTSTRRPDGQTVDLTYWLVRTEDGNFVCNSYEEGVRCQANPVARTAFASAKVDPFFDLPRSADAFSSVRKESRQRRVAGQPGTCFEAVPAGPSPAPGSPDPTPDRFRYELCYSEEGILLFGRRTVLDDDGTDTAESFVEITSLSRVVEPSELQMPGPVVEPDDL